MESINYPELTGPDNWMSALSQVPQLYDEFKIELVNIIAEGDHVFAMLHATACGFRKNDC